MIKQDWMTIVAGNELVNDISNETLQIKRTPLGYYESESLCRLQERQAARGILGVEIIRSAYGHSVRYDSGLQNFGLVRSGKGVSLDDAIEFCKRWVAEDPKHRYAWMRNQK